MLYLPMLYLVAPRAGAWIETYKSDSYPDIMILSPLAQGRGLKHFYYILLILSFPVAPRAGAWIETLLAGVLLLTGWSPLAQGRGLKQTNST